MSSSQLDDGGSVVICHLNPSSIQSDAASATQGGKAPVTRVDPLKAFYKGEPEALGVTQIFIGIYHFIIGIILCVEERHYRHSFLVFTGIPFWAGIVYVISGSLSVAASNKAKLGMVRSSLVMNTISAVAAAISIIIFVFGYFLYLMLEGFRYSKDYCWYTEQSQICEGQFYPETVRSGMMGLMFAFIVLEFCIAISVSVFGCKTTCRSSLNETTVIVYQNISMNTADPSKAPAVASSSEALKTD